VIAPLLSLALLAAVAEAPAAVAEPPAVGPATRLAVLILPDRATSPALADSLAEVVISRIAERGGVQLVGTAELRRRLDIAPGADQRAAACLDDIACLGRAAVALGVRRVVTGTVRQESGNYLVNLVLTDVETGKIEGRFFRLIFGGIDALVAAAQEGTDVLFRPRTDPARLRVDSVPPGSRVMLDGAAIGMTPLLSGPLGPGPHSLRVERDGHFAWTGVVNLLPANDLEIKLSPDQLPQRRRWPSSAMAGTAIGAALALGLGGTLGVFSQIESPGGSRRAAQDDIERRENLALSANIAFFSAAVLAIGAATLWLLYRRDISGE
jgi:hypothetical protein